MQQEQDIIQRGQASSGGGIGSLRKENEKGEIIITTLDTITFDMDQDMDSEDEEMNQSRIEMKKKQRHAQHVL